MCSFVRIYGMSADTKSSLTKAACLAIDNAVKKGLISDFLLVYYFAEDTGKNHDLICAPVNQDKNHLEYLLRLLK